MKHHQQLRLIAAVWAATALTTLAQGTGFTYQGCLNSGTNPANGRYDLTFGLFSVSSGVGQVGVTQTNLATGVSNGLFTVALDFGANFPGADRWLEIAARTNGVGAFTTLTPRQKITPAPYAIYSANAASATTAGTVSGAVPAANLTGGILDARLSGNVALLNATQNFTGSNNFTGALAATNLNSRFAGNGSGLTNVNAALLGGLAGATFWRTNGNAGANPTNGAFLGTTDKLALQLKVNGVRALRLEPATDEVLTPYPNLVVGIYSTIASYGGVIAGGEDNHIETNAFMGVIAGGINNVIERNAYYGAILGGYYNFIQDGGYASVIGGGWGNTVATNAIEAVIGGGLYNSIQTPTSPLYTLDGSTIGGGAYNVISNTTFSTIAGGNNSQILDSGLATVGGGGNNLLQFAAGGTIGGGTDNAILTNATYATIGGGFFNGIRDNAFYFSVAKR